MNKLNYYMIFVLYHKDEEIESYMVKKTPLSLSVMEERFPEIFEKISKDRIRRIQQITKEQFDAIGEVDYFACERSMQLLYEEKQKQKRKNILNGLVTKFCNLYSTKK